MIHFKSISKALPDGTHALRNVSIEIPRGQFCAVLGPSGAGKSTLLRAVNGLTKPTHGSVSIDGVQMCPASEKRLRQRVAMIHQHFNLTNRMTVDGVFDGARVALINVHALDAQYRPVLRHAQYSCVIALR